MGVACHFDVLPGTGCGYGCGRRGLSTSELRRRRKGRRKWLENLASWGVLSVVM